MVEVVAVAVDAGTDEIADGGFKVVDVVSDGKDGCGDTGGASDAESPM